MKTEPDPNKVYKIQSQVYREEDLKKKKCQDCKDKHNPPATPETKQDTPPSESKKDIIVPQETSKVKCGKNSNDCQSKCMIRKTQCRCKFELNKEGCEIPQQPIETYSPEIDKIPSEHDSDNTIKVLDALNSQFTPEPAPDVFKVQNVTIHNNTILQSDYQSMNKQKDPDGPKSLGINKIDPMSLDDALKIVLKNDHNPCQYIFPHEFCNMLFDDLNLQVYNKYNFTQLYQTCKICSQINSAKDRDHPMSNNNIVTDNVSSDIKANKYEHPRDACICSNGKVGKVTKIMPKDEYRFHQLINPALIHHSTNYKFTQVTASKIQVIEDCLCPKESNQFDKFRFLQASEQINTEELRNWFNKTYGFVINTFNDKLNPEHKENNDKNENSKVIDKSQVTNFKTTQIPDEKPRSISENSIHVDKADKEIKIENLKNMSKSLQRHKSVHDRILPFIIKNDKQIPNPEQNKSISTEQRFKYKSTQDEQTTPEADPKEADTADPANTHDQNLSSVLEEKDGMLVMKGNQLVLAPGIDSSKILTTQLEHDWDFNVYNQGFFKDQGDFKMDKLKTQPPVNQKVRKLKTEPAQEAPKDANGNTVNPEEKIDLSIQKTSRFKQMDTNNQMKESSLTNDELINSLIQEDGVEKSKLEQRRTHPGLDQESAQDLGSASNFKQLDGGMQHVHTEIPGYYGFDKLSKKQMNNLKCFPKPVHFGDSIQQTQVCSDPQPQNNSAAGETEPLVKIANNPLSSGIVPDTEGNPVAHYNQYSPQHNSAEVGDIYNWLGDHSAVTNVYNHLQGASKRCSTFHCDCSGDDSTCKCNKCGNKLVPSSCDDDDIQCYVKNALLIEYSQPKTITAFVEAMQQKQVPKDWQMCNWFKMDKGNLNGIQQRVYLYFQEHEWELHLFRNTSDPNEIPYLTSVQLSKLKICEKTIEEIKSEKAEKADGKGDNKADDKQLDLDKIATTKPGDEGKTKTKKNKTDKQDNKNPKDDKTNPEGPRTPKVDPVPGEENKPVPMSKLKSINDVNVLDAQTTKLPEFTSNLDNLVYEASQKQADSLKHTLYHDTMVDFQELVNSRSMAIDLGKHTQIKLIEWVLGAPVNINDMNQVLHKQHLLKSQVFETLQLNRTQSKGFFVVNFDNIYFDASKSAKLVAFMHCPFEPVKVEFDIAARNQFSCEMMQHQDRFVTYFWNQNMSLDFMDTKQTLQEVQNLQDFDLWRTRFVEGIIASKEFKIRKKHDPLFNLQNLIQNYNQNMQERIQLDLKFDLNQRETTIVDSLTAENDNLHQKIIRERIKSEEVDSWGSVHLDICFVRTLQEKEHKCQRNFIVTVTLLKTSVFPELISIHKADLNCKNKGKQCKKFCAKENDLKHIDMKLEYDFVQLGELVKEGFNLESYVEISKDNMNKTNSFWIETADFIRIRDGDIKVINFFKIDLELDRHLFCNMSENSWGEN